MSRFEVHERLRVLASKLNEADLAEDAQGMKKKNPPIPRPTEAELELLQILWSSGPRTVRQIHEALPKDTAYTTTLKILQKMTEKGLVVRDESQRSHVYSAAIAADRTQRQLVRHLIQSAFGGSPAGLVMHALSDRSTSPEELREIRRLLRELEKEGKR